MLFSLPPLDPPKLEIKPVIEFRMRSERRTNRDFLSSKHDDRTDALNRLRVGVQLQWGPTWSGEAQYQYAHDAIWRKDKNFSEDASDLNLAFARHKAGSSEWTLGRQKINIGVERLIGTLEWSMVGRSFDGIRYKTPTWDAYAFKIGVAKPKPKYLRIAGVSNKNPYGLTSLIFKHDGKEGESTDIWTLSHLWQKTQGKWSFAAEGAVQGGHIPGKTQRGWAINASAHYQFSKATRGYFEINAASGGGDADTTLTFDNLVPTNHKFYGSMDLQSWRNMEEVSLGIDHQFNPQWSLKAHVHSFALRSAKDAWYSAGGAPNVGGSGAFVDPTGRSGRDVGRELDIEFSYKHNAQLTLTGGVSGFWPGSFVKARNGGSAQAQHWAFFMVQLRF